MCPFNLEINSFISMMTILKERKKKKKGNMCGEIDKNSPFLESDVLGPNPASMILNCEALGKLLNSAGSLAVSAKQKLNKHLFNEGIIMIIRGLIMIAKIHSTYPVPDTVLSTFHILLPLLIHT